MPEAEIDQGTLIENRYRIQKVLGQGGFGRTYLASDEHRFDELCVLKEFVPSSRAEYTVKKSRALFEKEALVLYQINHPQIPKFKACFAFRERLFLVQEYIDGKTYSDLLRERKQLRQLFSEAEVIQWLRELLPVLTYLHSRHIVHRDISPDNVMLPFGQSQPMLIDFGLVKQTVTQLWADNADTTSGSAQPSFVGKFGYAAPEQMRMGQCYPCSDLYALGVTAVVLLTGIEPNLLLDQQSLEWQWQDKVKISDDLAKILDKMLAHRPQNRYQSAQEVLGDLHALAFPGVTSVPTPQRELQIEIDTASLERQVAEIEEMDYFQQLLKQADSLRNSVETNPLPQLEAEVPRASTLLGETAVRKPAGAGNPEIQPVAATPPKLNPLTERSRQILPSRSRLQTVLFFSMIVTALVMGVRHLGMLQSLELKAFDQLTRLRPAQKPESRLLVVKVTEKDLQLPQQKQKKGSLSDLALTRLLENLERYQPRAIGLNIYRDYAVNPKYANLATRLRQSDRLIGVCKVSDPEVNEAGISPPPEIPTERLGFSDFVVDPDGIVRRHLLALSPDPTSRCTTPYAFSVQLAFRYLAAEGILPKYTPDGFLQLGNVVFKPLKAHTGGYQGVDAWGHQVLLNYRSYRSPQKIAAQVTLSDVLTGQINPNSVKDRIVLIGTTSSSFPDYWLTPYSNGQGFDQQMPGVLVQAQMVSQILSAVLDQRLLLWVWPVWGETFWVWGWSLIGGTIAWRLLSPLHLGLAVGATLGSLYGLCYVLLVQSSCWVPLVPSALALVATGCSVAAYTQTQARRRHHIISKLSHELDKVTSPTDEADRRDRSSTR